MLCLCYVYVIRMKSIKEVKGKNRDSTFKLCQLSCTLAEYKQAFLKIDIIIPAHNEAALIGKTLESLVSQTLLPRELIVVDDNSSDGTAAVVEEFSARFPFVRLIKNTSTASHLPGSKVINAFHKGYEHLKKDYEMICKFDADLIFPKNYLEKIVGHFNSDPKIGMAGGFCQISRNGEWVLENLTDKDHLRGALKAYRKECFLEIGKLKPSMGWDTVDELLAQYHGWKIRTDESLMVKHLKPTGMTYGKEAKLRQGEAFYKLHYGLPITLIASAKLAYNKKKPGMFLDYLQGYFNARSRRLPYLVSEKEGAFIRRLRYKKMLSKLF